MVSKVADIVFVKGDKVLLVQQRKKIAEGLWSYPGGRVEEDETINQSVIREVIEELSVDITNCKLFRIYNIKTDIGELEINTFIGEFTGNIKLRDDELMDYGWFSLKELQQMFGQLRSLIVIEQAKDVLSI